MAVFYRNPEFTLRSVESVRRSDGLAAEVQRWRGAMYMRAAFEAAHARGEAMDSALVAGASGYVTEVSGSDEDEGWSVVSLTVTLPPDVERVEISTGRSVQSISVAGDVVASTILPGASQVNGEHRVTYLAPEVRYDYWSLTLPDGPAYEVFPEDFPAVLSVVTYADRYAATGDAAGRMVSRKWSATGAPADLKAGLPTLTLQTRLTGHEAVPVEYTPWYRCRDVVAVGYFSSDE